MFGFFKRKKRQPSISDALRFALQQEANRLHLDLYIDHQILFQVVPAKHYAQRGISGSDLDGFVEIHFFHKNKTLTLGFEPLAKELAERGEFIHFEEPKGNHNYMRAIGKVPKVLEDQIHERLKTMYATVESTRISIKYANYGD